MWHRYRVELYPHFGQSSGIRDKYGHELQFPSAFRQQRGSSEPKGIIQITQEKVIYMIRTESEYRKSS